MNFVSPNYKDASPDSIPGDSAIAKRAWECAPQLGVDPKQLVQESFFTHSYYIDPTGRETTNFICGRGIFLSRQLDGVAFFSADDSGSDTEGFSLELGRYGQIRLFSLRWSDIDRDQSHQTASPGQIIECIKSHITIVLPGIDEQDYFARLRALASVRKLTVTRITPYYAEYDFGQVPTNNVPCKFVTPLAELDAVADFGNSNATVRLVSPILSSEVSRLLGRP